MKSAVSSKAKPRGQFHHGNLRRVLLDETLVLIAEAGVAAVSVRELARRAGVTHAAAYRHFASRETLLAAVATEGFVEMRAALAGAAAAHTGSSLDRLMALGTAYLAYARSHAAHYRIMFGGDIAHRDQHAELAEASRAAFGVVIGEVHAGHERHELAGASVLEIAVTAWALVHGLATLILDGQLGESGLDEARQKSIGEVATGILRAGLTQLARS